MCNIIIMMRSRIRRILILYTSDRIVIKMHVLGELLGQSVDCIFPMMLHADRAIHYTASIRENENRN